MPRRFVFDFPLFVLKRGEVEDSVIPLEVLQISGNRSVAFFTDDDLASRCAAKSPGADLFEISGIEQLVAVLEALPEEVTHVAFDPEQNTAPTVLDRCRAIEWSRQLRDRNTRRSGEGEG